MSKVIYALSGDPITYGHIDIIKRASEQFDSVLVAIGNNPDKNYLLTLEERVGTAKASLVSFSNVEVIYFEGLLVDFAYQVDATAIIRGVRNSQDFAFEYNINQVNNTQRKLETFLMFANSDLAHVSSSNVKAVQKEHGNTLDFVPLPVKQILERKISNQCLMGITGLMGSGKSWIGEEIEKYSIQKIQESGDSHVRVHNIDLDTIAREVSLSDQPGYLKVRTEVEAYFGTNDRADIARQAFDPKLGRDNPKLAFLNQVYRDAIMVEFRRQIRGKKGIILINSAILVESDMLRLCNNLIYLVSTPDDVRFARTMKGRNITEDEIRRRSLFVLNEDQKYQTIADSIESEGSGVVTKLCNDEGVAKIEDYYWDMVSKSSLGTK